jgi:hypothetical protein
MADKVQYVCPHDPDVVLLEEAVDADLGEDKTVLMSRVEKELRCPKCGRVFKKDDCSLRMI